MRKISLFLTLFLLLACNLPIAAPGQTAPPSSLPELAATATATSIPIVAVPSSIIQLGDAAYRSYQMPGDSFRFVCVEPCTVDPKLMFAQYAGFRNAHQIMVKVTGVDILPEMMPVDIHSQGDAICGHLGDGPLAFTYYVPPNNPVVCSYLFDYAQGLNGAPYTPQLAAQLDQQTIFIHEYLHLIFVGRLPNSVEAIHDFVTPLAPHIAGHVETDLCSYHPQSPPGDFGGYLFQNLCAQNGFHLEDLAPVMIKLDGLYQSDAGQVQQAGYEHPSPSAAQFRDILNDVLGSDTTQAFADACWPPGLFGNSYSLSYECTHPVPTVAPSPVK